MSVLLGGLCAVTGAAASEPTPDEEILEHFLQQRAEDIASLGITRIDHEDGTYIFALPEALETPDSFTRNGVRWVYDGQQRFRDGADPLEPVPVPPESVEEATSLREQLLGSIAVDEYGRRWLAVEADLKLVDDAIARYDALVAAQIGLEPDHNGAERNPPEDVDCEADAVLHPFSWTAVNCPRSTPEHDLYFDGADTRQLTGIPMTPRQQKTVLLYIYAGGRVDLDTVVDECTGTMIGSRWVITAGHCMKSDTSVYYPGNVYACTHGNNYAMYGLGGHGLSCLKVEQALFPDEDRLSSINSDYAILKLADAPGVGWMAMSSASNRTIESSPSFKAAYPDYKTNCYPNAVGSHFLQFWSRQQFWAEGELFDATLKRIKTELPTGPGESGAAFYYYPNGCCGSHYITGLNVGYVDALRSYSGGPKASAFRDWVIANMD